LEAYRFYLVRHLTGDRCADGDLINNGPPSINLMTGRVNEVLGWGASAFFAEKLLVPPLKPLSEQETTPHSLDGVAAGARTCQDAPCQNANHLTQQLAFDEDGQPRLAADHDTDAWRAALQATLTALDAWQPADGQADDVYREKTWVYNNLYAMTLGANRESVMRSWLNCIKQSRTTVSDRAQWLLPLSALIGRMALDPSNPKLVDLLRQQDDPVIKLYVQLEPLAPRGPDVILPML
jgi:hypothetical protein